MVQTHIIENQEIKKINFKTGLVTIIDPKTHKEIETFNISVLLISQTTLVNYIFDSFKREYKDIYPTLDIRAWEEVYLFVNQYINTIELKLNFNYSNFCFFWLKQELEKIAEKLYKKQLKNDLEIMVKELK